MKGTIVNCAAQLVTSRFGENKWKESLSKAGLCKNKTYGCLGDVDDSEVMAILKGVSEATSLSLAEVLNTFGQYWSQTYAPKIYDAYFNKAKNARELLLNLDHIHTAMTKSVKSARPPHFRYEWQGKNRLIMHYSSRRGLVFLMPGLILGVANYYHETIQVHTEGNAVYVDFA